MDIVLVMLLCVYLAQGALLFFDRFLEPKRLKWLMAVGIFALILSFINHTLFLFVLLFALVFFSRTCRLSDYGFSYHFTLIVAIGFVFGPIAGLLFGLVPRLLIPYVRPDIQIIDIIIGSIILTLVGLASGFIPFFSPDLFLSAALILLIIYNITRFVALYGKIHSAKNSIRIIINIALNYYLITFYLIKGMGMLGYVAS